MSVARRGEVWLVDLGMTAKVRPAVVVSVPAEDTDRALVTIVPHTVFVARAAKFRRRSVRSGTMKPFVRY